MITIRKACWSTLILTALTAGCAGEPETPPVEVTPTPVPVAPAETPKVDAPKTEEPKAEMPKVEEPKAEMPKVEEPKADAPKTAAVKFTEEEIAGIKLLPVDEQDLAMTQAKCPVSEEALGGMGKPIKVSIEGKNFYICCKGCSGDVETKPAEVLAKLAKNAK